MCLKLAQALDFLKHIFVFTSYSWRNVDECGDITFACVRYNPEDGTCDVRKVNSGIQQVLLAKCREVAELSPQAKRLKTASGYYQRVYINDFVLHGMTEGGVVLGHVRFSHPYKADVEDVSATAFALDLNVALKLYEPAASFAAISFPVAEDLLKAKPQFSGFGPYYKSFEKGSLLSGLVAFEGDVCAKQVTIHSFETTLEWSPI